MGNGFKKFQRKIRVGSIIRAVLFGISLGVITVASLMLFDKLTAQNADAGRYITVAVIPTAVGIMIMLPILIPTQKRLAKRIDNSLGLGEKIQTMVEFKNETGKIVILQREDADRILQNTPQNKVKGMCTWLFVLLPIVASISMLGAVIVSANEPEGPKVPTEEIFSLSPWQEQALKDLTEEVRNSDMEETPRDSVVKQLEALLVKVKSAKKASTMKQAVIECIVKIHATVEDHNTYDVTAKILSDSSNEDLSLFGESIGSGELLLVVDSFQKIAEQIIETPDSAVELKNDLGKVLTYVSSSGDQTLISVLTKLYNELEAVTAETDRQTLVLLMVNTEGEITEALRPQFTNEETVEKAIYRLMEIFKININDIPESVFEKESMGGSSGGDSGEDSDNDDEERGDSGGLGSGDREVAANDEIYDHESLGYKKYAELIDKYSIDIAALEVDGKIDPEIAKLIKDYIALLNRP